MSKHSIRLLSIGDSYTIGESLPIFESFPYLLTQQLRKKGKWVEAPEIIAKTGFTSGELATQLLHSLVHEKYDFVTVLIGVNNQYRHLPLSEFENDFQFLINKAIHLTGNQPKNVLVLSIPDWGVTPFGLASKHKNISQEIDKFNLVCLRIAKKMNCPSFNITEELRRQKDDLSLLAKDQLHYSAKAHQAWADLLALYIGKN